MGEAGRRRSAGQPRNRRWVLGLIEPLKRDEEVAVGRDHAPDLRRWHRGSWPNRLRQTQGSLASGERSRAPKGHERRQLAVGFGVRRAGLGEARFDEGAQLGAVAGAVFFPRRQRGRKISMRVFMNRPGPIGQIATRRNFRRRRQQNGRLAVGGRLNITDRHNHGLGNFPAER
jgi:hypothetical protein